MWSTSSRAGGPAGRDSSRSRNGESQVPLRRMLFRPSRQRVVVLLAGYAVLLAACTGGKPAAPVRAAVGLGGPAAMSLLAAPGRLVDRPVVSTGCGHHPAVRPGTTALLRVAVPPAAAAGARQREFRLHVPADYDP